MENAINNGYAYSLRRQGMKQLIINLETPEITALKKTGEKDAIAKVHHDMAAPLQHYFIYTGHNSYLTGKQLSSDCSEIPIIRDLENGVRGIELDLWPNSAKDNMHVLHGRLKLQRLDGIKMVMQIFGDMLYYPESGCLEEFPSPEELKHKIILSTKPPKEYLELKNIKDRESSLSMEDFDDDIAETKADYKSDIDQGNENNDGYQQKSVSLAAPQYKRLIAIHAGKAKRSLRHSLRTETNKVNRLSLSEQILEEAATSYGKDVVRFTQKNILRVFPKGTRVTSTNFKPIIGWMHGAQMVAFNMQPLKQKNDTATCAAESASLLVSTMVIFGYQYHIRKSGKDPKIFRTPKASKAEPQTSLANIGLVREFKIYSAIPAQISLLLSLFFVTLFKLFSTSLTNILVLDIS